MLTDPINQNKNVMIINYHKSIYIIYLRSLLFSIFSCLQGIRFEHDIITFSFHRHGNNNNNNNNLFWSADDEAINAKMLSVGWIDISIRFGTHLLLPMAES